MDIFDVISSRRSAKEYADRAVTPEEVETLLEAAVKAPNHRMTEPWRFYVLGPEARAEYGRALGLRKARRADTEEAAAAVVEKVQATHRKLPAMLAVSVVVDENPEIREEDVAATWMAIQNLSLAAHAMGLGTHIKTGAIMDDPAARAAVGVPDDEKIVATLTLGEPVRLPEPKPRRRAADFTTWVS